MTSTEAIACEKPRPYFVQEAMMHNVLRFTSNHRNKKRYRRWVSERGILEKVVGSARARWWRRGKTSLCIDNIGHNTFSSTWTEMVHRSINRNLVPKGFVIKYCKVEGGQSGGSYLVAYLMWGPKIEQL